MHWPELDGRQTETNRQHLRGVGTSPKSPHSLPDRRLTVAELDLEALLAQVPPVWFVDAISPYPAVLQDLAVVVDEGIPAATVETLVSQTGGFLLKDVQLFDVYRGEPIPAGKKSLAYALTFQAPDKTLRDAIVAKQVKRIVKRLQQELGAEQRSQEARWACSDR